MNAITAVVIVSIILIILAVIIVAAFINGFDVYEWFFRGGTRLP